MTIAAHIDPVPLHGSILCRPMMLLAAQNPGDHFIFFINKIDKSIRQPPNCTPVVISPAIKNNLLLHYWYNFKLPTLLTRYNADAFINESSVCSFRADIPQFTLIRDIEFLGNKSKKLEPVLYKRRIFPLLVNKITGILVTNELFLKKVHAFYPATAAKTTVIYPGLAGSYKPITDFEAEQVKSNHTGGKDFFAFNLTVSNKHYLLPVLKAFSLFKKWQRSNMQLVIINEHSNIPDIIKDFHLYKYRDDVKDIRSIKDDEVAVIIASSYALVCGNGGIDKGGMAIKAMKCQVPVVYLAGEKIFKGAAMEILPDEKAIADSMMLLYKDEHSRKKLINEGINYASRFSWENTSESIWRIITTHKI